MKIFPVGAVCFTRREVQTDRQTDSRQTVKMTKMMVAILRTRLKSTTPYHLLAFSETLISIKIFERNRR